jgi:hypothetical protein
MCTPCFQWLDTAGKALRESYEQGTLDHTMIEHVVIAAKEAATHEVKNLRVELRQSKEELAETSQDLKWYREKHPELLNRLSQTGQALAVKEKELVSTTAILSSTLQVVGGTGATELKGKYDELEKKYIETRAALEMITCDNAILKRQHEEDQAELRKYRRENGRLNKRLCLAETGAKELEGGKITP